MTLTEIQSGTRPVLFCVWRDLSELRRALRRVEDSERNFRAFFESIDDIVLVASLDGRLLYANEVFERRLGHASATCSDLHVTDLHAATDRASAQEVFAEMLRGDRDVCPLPLLTRDGQLLPTETRVWLGRWNGENCIFGVCKDLSAQEAARQRFEHLFRSNPAMMALVSQNTSAFTDVNDAFLQKLGYTRDEVIGRTSPELGLFVEPDQHRAVIAHLASNRRLTAAEVQVRTSSGEIIEGMLSGEIVGRPGHEERLTVLIDITERKRAERSLQESEELFRSTIVSMDDLVFVLDEHGRFADVHQPTTEGRLYRPREHFVGAHYTEVLPAEVSTAIDRVIEQLDAAKDEIGRAHV